MKYSEELLIEAIKKAVEIGLFPKEPVSADIYEDSYKKMQTFLMWIIEKSQ